MKSICLSQYIVIEYRLTEFPPKFLRISTSPDYRFGLVFSKEEFNKNPIFIMVGHFALAPKSL